MLRVAACVEQFLRVTVELAFSRAINAKMQTTLNSHDNSKTRAKRGKPAIPREIERLVTFWNKVHLNYFKTVWPVDRVH